MNPLKKQQYDLCKLRGMKDLADKIEEIVKWINQQKPISPSGENGQPEGRGQIVTLPEPEVKGKYCKLETALDLWNHPLDCFCHQPEVKEECYHDHLWGVNQGAVCRKCGKLVPDPKVEEKESDWSKYCHQPKESIDHEMSNGSHIIHYKGEPCEMCLDISEYLLWRRTHCA